ncbi:hypothetical protein ACOQFB_05290 [Anaeromyxobacter sp. Red801]|uniref:hypothetical protein n=1 Tax=Anaeromyxobacter sp. Red801 TaxID=3411632 RepID=UPI003B9DE4BD
MVESRRPRASFTAALERMCSRLDERSRAVISWKDFLGDPSSKEFEVTDLWVAGSYARGAPTCGDLDLILGVRPEGWRSAGQIAARIFGAQADVRFYSGTPEKNSSGVAFPEAVHIWTAGTRWRDALASIKEFASAGHFARPHDIIPLRPEQVSGSPDLLKDLVALKESGHIDWRFLPYEPRPQSGLEQHIVGLVEQRWGKQSRAIFPFVWDYLTKTLPFFTFEHVDQTELDCGGVHVSVGRPSAATDRLDELTTSRLALMPHLSRRGPNGIWEIRRGPNHPLEQAVAGAVWFVLTSPNSVILPKVRARRWSSLGATGVELFATEELARSAAQKLAATATERWTTKAVQGSSLLDLVSHADFVQQRTSARAGRPRALKYWGADPIGHPAHVETRDAFIKLLRRSTYT